MQASNAKCDWIPLWMMEGKTKWGNQPGLGWVCVCAQNTPQSVEILVSLQLACANGHLYVMGNAIPRGNHRLGSPLLPWRRPWDHTQNHNIAFDLQKCSNNYLAWFVSSYIHSLYKTGLAFFYIMHPHKYIYIMHTMLYIKIHVRCLLKVAKCLVSYYARTYYSLKQKSAIPLPPYHKALRTPKRAARSHSIIHFCSKCSRKVPCVFLREMVHMRNFLMGK